MKKRILAGILTLCMVMVLLPASVFAIGSDTAPTIAGPTAMTQIEGYTSVSTAVYTVTGFPVPTVTQDTTYNDKIVWNDTTKKFDIAAGLAAGIYPVVLTAANGVAPTPTLTFTLTVSAWLTTILAESGSQTGNMFDMEVTGRNPVLINSFGAYLEPIDGKACSVSVYYREGGYSRYETDPTAWTLIGTQSGIIPAGLHQPTPVSVGGVTLEPGVRYGFYVTATDGTCNLIYTNMITGTVFSDDNLKIISGIGRGAPVFYNSVNSDRCWNGIVFYTPLDSSDANLSGLSVTGAALNETFSPDTTAYTATVNNVTSITLAATKNGTNATMTLQAGSAAPVAWDGSASPQTLNAGVNVFTIAVTSQDGTTNKTYTVTVTKNTAPTITGLTEMTLTLGDSVPEGGVGCTGAYILTGYPFPTVTQDKTYNGKIVLNNTTKKLEIAAGLAVGSYPVVLTAANGISPNAALTFTLTVSATGALTTLFRADNDYTGNMFDMEVIGAYPIRIDSFDLNLFTPASATCTVSVYYREGGYSGYETNASAWTLIGTQSGIVSAGFNRPTPINIGGAVLQPETRYGFYVTVSNGGVNYTAMPAGTEYSDGNLSIFTGIGREAPVFTGRIFFGKAWNGTVHYTPTVSSDASLSNLTVTGAALNETFSPDTTAYTATVTNDVTGITIAATKNGANASMTLQTESLSPAAWDGSASAQNLSVGMNVFTVTVTSQDGTAKKTYTVTVTRTAAPAITGPTAMALATGYSAVSTSSAYILTGYPLSAVTQDTTYDGKIVWNNATKKLDIAAGLPVGRYPVVLTAANGVLPAATLTFTLTVYTPGAGSSLTTTFHSNNSFAGNMFDMEVAGRNPVLINSFAVNLEQFGGQSSTVSVYYRDGGYSGYETNASAWTLLGSQSGIIPAGRNLPTPLAVGGVVLEPGICYGFYVTVSNYGSSMLYTNMPMGTEYSDNNLRILSGLGLGTPDFKGSLFWGRAWNGTVYYTPLDEHDAFLSGLTVTGATLNEPFSPDTAAYTATVNNVTGITLAATKNGANATMTLKAGSAAPIAWDGTASAQNLSAGVNVFTITVTSQDGTAVKTYTVTVTRNQAPTITGLAQMGLTAGYEAPAGAAPAGAATSTAAFTLTGYPVPTVTADKTYGGKIVWNNTTKKLDIAAGLAPGIYPVTLTASNGILPAASMTFTLKVYTTTAVNRNLLGITPPAAVTGLANGTARTIDALKLPLTVTLATDNGNDVASVTWDLTSCTYNPSVKTAQTFTANGTVTLPLNVANPNRIPLSVTVSVTVNAAASASQASASQAVSSKASSTISEVTSGAPTDNEAGSAASVPAMGDSGSVLSYLIGALMLAAAGVFITVTVRKRRVKV